MIFIVVLIAAALLIAASAAFFSVYGLAQVFAGAFISVIIMGVALEIGKLVAASFLYRYWDKISIALKAYLMVAVIVLMSITSMGISGYLTSAYQTDTVGLRDTATTLKSYTTELETLNARKADMDRQISQLPVNFVAARQKLMASFGPEYKKIDARVDFLKTEIAPLQKTKNAVEAKVGPIIFISKVLGSETDDAIFWLIVLIVVVFDPLAVALTLAANIAWADYKKPKISTPVDAIDPPSTVIDEARRLAIMERDHQQA
jgi:cell division protein FtsB